MFCSEQLIRPASFIMSRKSRVISNLIDWLHNWHHFAYIPYLEVFWLIYLKQHLVGQFMTDFVSDLKYVI